MRIALPFLLLLALSTAPLAAENKETPRAGDDTVVVSQPGRVELTRVIEVTARVQAIDAKTRTVTLLAPNDVVIEHVASEEVRNFDQIEIGNIVEAVILQSLRLELVNDGKLGDAEAKGAMARAEQGAKPGAAVGSRVSFITEVVRVDRPNNVISLKGPEGEVVDFDVQNPGHFDVVKLGDKVLATYTEAVAIEVRPSN